MNAPEFKILDRRTNKIIPLKNIDFEEEIVNKGFAWKYFAEVTFIRYIGLKDGNNSKIFEGDIFEEDDRRKTKHIVTFNKERGGFYPFAHGDGCGCCEYEVVYDSTEGKVIGNIYENPELAEDINKNE